jgi:hypothetical protein
MSEVEHGADAPRARSGIFLGLRVAHERMSRLRHRHERQPEARRKSSDRTELLAHLGRRIGFLSGLRAAKAGPSPRGLICLPRGDGTRRQVRTIRPSLPSWPRWWLRCGFGTGASFCACSRSRVFTSGASSGGCRPSLMRGATVAAPGFRRGRYFIGIELGAGEMSVWRGISRAMRVLRRA